MFAWMSDCQLVSAYKYDLKLTRLYGIHAANHALMLLYWHSYCVLYVTVPEKIKNGNERYVGLLRHLRV